MKPSTKQKLIKAIDMAVRALELKCGGPGSGVPGPCPTGGSKPSAGGSGGVKERTAVESSSEIHAAVEKHTSGKKREHYNEIKTQMPKGVSVSKVKFLATSAATKVKSPVLLKKLTDAGWKHEESLRYKHPNPEVGTNMRLDVLSKPGKTMIIHEDNSNVGMAEDRSTLSIHTG